MTFHQSQLNFSIESDVFMHAKTFGTNKTEILLWDLLNKIKEVQINDLKKEIELKKIECSEAGINLTNIFAGE